MGNFWRISCIEYESNGDRKKTQSVEEYLCKIRTCLKDIINNDLKKSDTWKIELTIAKNLSFSIENYEKYVMHSKNCHLETMINDKADKVMENIFESLKNRYQNNLESIKGNEFLFNLFVALEMSSNKNETRDRSYIDFLDWIKNNKSSNKYNQ